MTKNLTRTITVGLSVVIAVMLGNKGDKFVSLSGALFCTLAAYLLPVIYHLKVMENSKK